MWKTPGCYDRYTYRGRATLDGYGPVSQLYPRQHWCSGSPTDRGLSGRTFCTDIMQNTIYCDYVNCLMKPTALLHLHTVTSLPPSCLTNCRVSADTSHSRTHATSDVPSCAINMVEKL